MALVLAFYRGGREALDAESWSGRVDEVLLVGADTWTFVAGQSSLVDMSIPSAEVVAAGYARATVTPGTPAWSAGRWTLPTAALVWPAMGTAEDVYAAVAFEPGVDDASSTPLWALYNYDDGTDTYLPLDTLDGTDFTVTFDLGVT